MSSVLIRNARVAGTGRGTDFADQHTGGQNQPSCQDKLPGTTNVLMKPPYGLCDNAR